MKIVKSIIFFLSFFAIGCNNSNKEAMRVYDVWKDSSMNSLKKQISLERDPLLTNFLSSELILFSSPKALDKSNFRFSIIKDFSGNFHKKGTPFYVIEYKMSGEKNIHLDVLLISEENGLHGYVFRRHPEIRMIKSEVVKIEINDLNKLFDFKPFIGENNTYNLSCCLSRFKDNKIDVKYFPPFSIAATDILYKLFFDQIVN